MPHSHWACSRPRFYGYGYPETSSANTGYEEDEAALLYLIVDDHAEVSRPSAHARALHAPCYCATGR